MIPVVASAYGGRGWPDTVGVADGRFYAIEWKDEGKQPEPIQLHRAKQIRKKGGFSVITDWPEAAVQAISDWLLFGTLPPLELRRKNGS